MVKIKDLKIGDIVQDTFDDITRDLVRKYSKLGGFAKLASNLIHDNDSVAEEAGHKGVIAHGLFSFGFIIKLIDDFLNKDKYGKIIKIGVEMRYPVRCGDTLITKAIVKEIKGKKVFFDIIQKTQTNIKIVKEGEMAKAFEAYKRGYISKKDREKGFIITKEIDEGILYYRERINSPGYAVVELFH